jgi:5'-3' exonuclease
MGLINSFCFINYEADDLIGALVDKLKGRIIIVSSDTDFYQCLDRADIYLTKQKKLFTKKNFREKYNVYPDNWPLAKAIGGCYTDSVIGIEGVGDPKSASSKALKYIRGEMGPGKVRDRIESIEGKALIDKNLPIVTLPYMVDLMPRFLIRKHKVTRKKLLHEFDKWHFVSLLERNKFAEWKRVFDL